MKSKPLCALAGGALALALLFALPGRSNGQAGADEAAFNALLTDIATQQAAVAANQTKIDEKLAAIAEDLRLARIFVGRGGGGGKVN